MSTMTEPRPAEIKSFVPASGHPQFFLVPVAKAIRAMPWRFAAISLLLLVPCFWQPHIEAGDLASHAYNAWLVRLIQQGRMPELSIGRQPTNVLFDYMLEGLIGTCGVEGAQRVAVSIAVLIFFWSAFSLVSAVVGKLPWFLTPVFAILAYGTVFNKGLFNYYLAGAFSLAALAMLWHATLWDAAVAPLLLGLGWASQPLPVLWAIAVFGYVLLARWLPARLRVLLFLVCVGALFGLRYFIRTHWTSKWEFRQVLHVTGIDQSFFLGHHFRIVSLALLAVSFVGLLHLLSKVQVLGLLLSIPVQIYVLCLIGCFLLPHTIGMPWYKASFGGVDVRIGWLAAVFLCAVLAQVENPVWYGSALGIVALVYFGFLYADHRAMNQLEQRVEELVSTLPPHARVIGRLYYPLVDGFDESMILDRACIGKCYSFGNYEAATGEFRVHASAGNSIVIWSMNPERRMFSAANQFFSVMPDGTLYMIYNCGDKVRDVCLRNLTRTDLPSLEE